VLPAITSFDLASGNRTHLRSLFGEDLQRGVSRAGGWRTALESPQGVSKGLLICRRRGEGPGWKDFPAPMAGNFCLPATVKYGVVVTLSWFGGISIRRNGAQKWRRRSSRLALWSVVSAWC